jgi:hypothetical protein
LLIIDGINYFPLDSATIPAHLSCMDSTCQQTLNKSINSSSTVCCELDQTKGDMHINTMYQHANLLQYHSLRNDL